MVMQTGMGRLGDALTEDFGRLGLDPKEERARRGGARVEEPVWNLLWFRSDSAVSRKGEEPLRFAPLPLTPFEPHHR